VNPTRPRRRRLSVITLALLTAFTGLQACTAGGGRQPARPLNDGEITRLAEMRMHNFGDARAGVRGTVGRQSAQISVNGWIDWRRALIYLSVSSAAQGGVALVQARPGVLAIRPETTQPGKPSPTSSNSAATGSPPVQPPADGWRVRPINLSDKQQTPLDNLLAFLFLIASERPDRTDLLKKLNTRWVRQDRTQNIDVDVILGPATMPETEPPQPGPSSSPSSAAPNPFTLGNYGGAVGYWLDAEGRLRKLETLLATNMPAAIELVRDDRTEIHAIDALGGRDISPAGVTDAEAEMLSLMRQRNYHTRQTKLTLTMPALPGTLRLGTGWLDWQRSVAYLSVRDLDDAARDTLVHASRTTVAQRKPETPVSGGPPLPAPRGGWQKTQWAQAKTETEQILYAAMSMAFNQRDDVTRMRAHARRLRVDVLHGVPMGVFELPGDDEQTEAPGTAYARYWLDNSGVLRRIELRTATGGFAQLDLSPDGSPPNLPASVL
jgi:hypothetical protein